jgi:hypothetical protein
MVSVQMFAVTAFASVAVLSVWGAQRAGLMDRAFGDESRHTADARGALQGSGAASASDTTPASGAAASAAPGSTATGSVANPANSVSAAPASVTPAAAAASAMAANGAAQNGPAASGAAQNSAAANGATANGAAASAAAANGAIATAIANTEDPNAAAPSGSAQRVGPAPQDVRDAVADVAAGLAPVLQAAKEDEATLEELGEREVAPPLPAANKNTPRPAARNPWSRGALPKELRDLKKAIASGARGNNNTVLALRRYNREHVTDPRGHLLLAQLYFNREWRADAINQYSIAYQRDPSSRGAPEMLKSLIGCVVQGLAVNEAEKAIVGIYGAEAAGALSRAAKASRDAKAVARLQALRARLK